MYGKESNFLKTQKTTTHKPKSTLQFLQYLKMFSVINLLLICNVVWHRKFNGFLKTIKWHWWFKLISETLQLDKFRLPAFIEAMSYET